MRLQVDFLKVVFRFVISKEKQCKINRDACSQNDVLRSKIGMVDRIQFCLQHRHRLYQHFRGNGV